MKEIKTIIKFESEEEISAAFEEGYTERGFALIKFTDQYKTDCSLQESSMAEFPCIWLGTSREDDINDRMHLTQSHAKALVEYLTHFIETGNLPEISNPDFDFRK